MPWPTLARSTPDFLSAQIQSMSSEVDGFYHLCRTLCVKDIAYYDAYDEAFLAYFKDIHKDALQLTEQLKSWLENPQALPLIRIHRDERVLDVADERWSVIACNLRQWRAR